MVKTMLLANKREKLSNAWRDRCCVSAATMLIFAETLSIFPVRVLFAFAPSPRTIFEIWFFIASLARNRRLTPRRDLCCRLPHQLQHQRFASPLRG